MAVIAQHHQQQAGSSSTTQHTLLIATADEDRRAFLVSQLDADGHSVYEADHAAAVVARLSEHTIDALILGGLEHPADAPALLRAVRAGEHPRIHPGLAVITLGATDELTVLRAYESGSDHHLSGDSGYLLLRAVLASVTRRALETVTSRHLHVGEIHIDRAARSVDVAGLVVELSRLEFELLVKFAGDPLRVFSKHELGRCIWRGQQVNERTVDSHVCRLRTRLTSAGAEAVLVNRWGHGWSLTRQDS
jgi:two-component system OmpR family response regulator